MAGLHAPDDVKPYRHHYASGKCIDSIFHNTEDYIEYDVEEEQGADHLPNDDHVQCLHSTHTSASLLPF